MLWVLWAFVIGTIVSAGYGVIVDQGFAAAAEGRLSGAGTNAIDLATVSVASIVLAVTLASAYKRSPFLQVVALLAAALCGVAAFRPCRGGDFSRWGSCW